jgi:hypothetical protein
VQRERGDGRRAELEHPDRVPGIRARASSRHAVVRARDAAEQRERNCMYAKNASCPRKRASGFVEPTHRQPLLLMSEPASSRSRLPRPIRALLSRTVTELPD